MSRKISGPRNKVSWKKKKQHLVQTRSKHKRLQKRVQRSPNLKAPSSPSPPFSPVPFNLFPHHSLSYSHAPLSFSFFFYFSFSLLSLCSHSNPRPSLTRSLLTRLERCARRLTMKLRLFHMLMLLLTAQWLATGAPERSCSRKTRL